jgi:hypothetical protein
LKSMVPHDSELVCSKCHSKLPDVTPNVAVNCFLFSHGDIKYRISPAHTDNVEGIEYFRNASAVSASK